MTTRALRPAHDELPVVFRYRPDRPVPFVDLRGDMVHWFHAERLQPAGGERLEATLQLGPGTYDYKFRLSDDTWVLDPENARTRSRDGVKNSLLVIGGADEPVLHAPAKPYLYLEDDGRVCVRAGLRRGAGERLVLRWDEGDGRRDLAMIAVAEEDEHLVFEQHVPVSARALEYTFLLDDGRCVGRAGGAGQAFRVTLASLKPAAPAWWRDAVLYSIFVDRFRRGGQRGGWGALPSDDKAIAGGDLEGVAEAIPYLADLGVTALHLTPIVLAGSAHRYDAIDPRRVDPALGGEAALTRVLDEAHKRGLRVLLDVTVTHVHREFFAFRDVRARGKRSPYWGWFYVRRHPFLEGPDPGYEHYQKGAWREPLLRVEEPEVVDYIAGTFERWARFGADGFRVDAAADVPIGLIRRASEAARAARSDVVLFGEVIPGNLHRFTGGALDAATDFPAEEALFDWILRKRAGARKTASTLARRRVDRGGPAWSAITFTATHDQHRLLTLLGDPRPARLAQLAVLLGAAVPMIYYGDELGLRGSGGERDFEDAWGDRCPMPWAGGGEAPAGDEVTLALVRAALRLRRERAALARGDEAFLAVLAKDGGEVDDVLAFRRAHGDEILDVVLHGGEGEREIALPEGAPSGVELLLAHGEVAFDPERGALRLGPFAAAVIARVPPPAALATFREITAHGRLLGGLAFQRGLVESPALPVKLYLTVTERCNIRCAHCITDAPAKTAEGRARQVQPWLVEALREVFSAADYFAFVHGGEAIVAPIFPEVLRAIQRARASRPGRADVHLLSNGVLLDEAWFRRLVDLGVTSLSVSLDGATPATNDVIRIGGRFTTVIENLRAIARVRRELGADVRVGVSTVVTASNVAELPALGRLVGDIGLDWLKVEEIYPCTPMARHDHIGPHDARVEAAMAGLKGTLAGTGVVIVDHRDPPFGCPCTAAADPAIAAFRAADDFANRTTFHPCRMEWEQACVDPDGSVHPVDYGHPVIGNLLQTSFLEMWNGEVMRGLRASALRRTPASVRRACPIGG